MAALRVQLAGAQGVAHDARDEARLLADVSKGAHRTAVKAGEAAVFAGARDMQSAPVGCTTYTQVFRRLASLVLACTRFFVPLRRGDACGSGQRRQSSERSKWLRCVREGLIMKGLVIAGHTCEGPG
jgi:hypothetical protein